jgi:hypothetical protein
MGAARPKKPYSTGAKPSAAGLEADVESAARGSDLSYKRAHPFAQQIAFAHECRTSAAYAVRYNGTNAFLQTPPLRRNVEHHCGRSTHHDTGFKLIIALRKAHSLLEQTREITLIMIPRSCG